MTRRANALVLLDDGWSCREVAKALLLDDDTIRGWRKLFEQGGIEGLTSFDMGGSAGFMSAAQEDNLKAWVAASLPRSTRQVGAWIELLDNARYHHAKLVQDWLSRPDCRIRLHFIPAYCPHLNPIERLWGVMHKHVAHNKCYATCTQFADATLGFLRETVPRNWANLCNSVTDNFRVISPKDFRVMA